MTDSNEPQNEAGEAAVEPEDYIDALKAEITRLQDERNQLVIAGAEREERIGELTGERNSLGEAIALAAQKAGIYNGEVDLTGPHLIMFCDDMRDEILRLRKANEEVWAKVGAVLSGFSREIRKVDLVAALETARSH